jgi:hypothetical protein
LSGFSTRRWSVSRFKALITPDLRRTDNHQHGDSHDGTAQEAGDQ